MSKSRSGFLKAIQLDPPNIYSVRKGNDRGEAKAGKEKAKLQGKILRWPKKKLDEREIKRRYELRLSAHSIAMIMCVSYTTIPSRLKEMGGEDLVKPKQEALLSLFEEGRRVNPLSPSRPAGKRRAFY